VKTANLTQHTSLKSKELLWNPHSTSCASSIQFSSSESLVMIHFYIFLLSSIPDSHTTTVNFLAPPPPKKSWMCVTVTLTSVNTATDSPPSKSSLTSCAHAQLCGLSPFFWGGGNMFHTWGNIAFISQQTITHTHTLKSNTMCIKASLFTFKILHCMLHFGGKSVHFI
jgi:hypothetical protein